MEVVVLDRFNGNTDPEDWISRAERYFNFLGFSEEHWLPLPSLYLDGEALEWFRWMFRNEQFFDWTHFKEKLALRFPKRTYAKSPVVDAQISNILALLQRIENKYSVASKQVLVEDAGISAAAVLSREISLAEENSRCVDNVESHLELFGTSIVEHSSHVDNMFDEMSTGVFTKEIQETSSAASFAADLDDIQSPRVFDECFPSCCPMIVAEVQPDTPNDMLDEESPGPKHKEAQLFDDCSPKDMSKRYVTTTFLDRGSKKSNIEFETFDNIYLAKLENSIAQSNRPLDELMLVVEHGKFTCEFSTHNILSQFSLVPAVDIFLITVPVIAIDICVWDPGICLEFLALTDFTENTEELLLLGCTGKFFFNADSNSMSRVWDPGQTCHDQLEVNYAATINKNSGPRLSGTAYCLSSCCMIMLNKIVLSSYSFNAGVSLMFYQNLISTVIVGILGCSGAVTVEKLNWKLIKVWIPMNLIFIGMLVSGMYSLKYINIAMVTILKNVTNILTAIGELYIFGKRQNQKVWTAMFVMIISAVSGGITDLSFEATGYAWQSVNCILTASYESTLRRVMDRAKQFTKSGSLNEVSMVLLNNGISIPFAIILIFLFDEWRYVINADVIKIPMFWVAATASGLLGLAISFTSMWFLKQIGPTTYSLVGSLNKIPISIAGACHQMHFMHLEVTVTTPRLPTLLLVRILDLNLEDKVLIQGGSIVMNQPQPNNDTNKYITRIGIGASRSNTNNKTRPSQRIIWDPH